MRKKNIGWGGIGVLLLGASLSWAEGSGFDWDVTYKGEVNRTVQGGIEKRTTYLDNLDLHFQWDFEKLASWRGASAFLYLLGNQGGKPSGDQMGDLQGLSNIEISKPADFRVYEAWLQQAWKEGQFSILAGLHDLNSEFYQTEASGLFFNSSFGVGKELSQTGKRGPSIFPITSPAIRFKIENGGFFIQSALFGAIPGASAHQLTRNGFLMISEMGYHSPEAENIFASKLALGFWSFTKNTAIAPLSEETDSVLLSLQQSRPDLNASGGYLLWNQGLSQSVSTFIRYGISTPEILRISSCFSTGIVTHSLFSETDHLGLGVAIANTSKIYQKAASTSFAPERAWELNYRYEWNWKPLSLALQPALHWIQNPSFANTNSALAVATRLEIHY